MPGQRRYNALIPTPARAPTADTGTPTGPRPGHPVRVRAQVADGRLHIGLDWTRDARPGADELTDARVRDLERLLHDLLQELAELPAAPAAAAFRPTAQQAALHTGGDAAPGTGRHVEQLSWRWCGPLDTERFTAARYARALASTTSVATPRPVTRRPSMSACTTTSR